MLFLTGMLAGGTCRRARAELRVITIASLCGSHRGLSAGSSPVPCVAARRNQFCAARWSARRLLTRVLSS